MSGWRVVVKHMRDTGPVKAEAVAAELGLTPHSISYYFSRAHALGLIDPCEGRAPGWWRLTRLGLEFAHGRVTAEPRCPGGLVFVATWLHSLPRDIRISQPVQPQEQDHAHH